MKRDRVVMARKIRQGDDDGAFDVAFWQKHTSDERTAAVWQLVLELVAMAKLDAGALRLRRDAVRVVRGKR